ncbi:TerC family protein [Cohnella candidum]|uniref:TerC family protein n=1 Tax=Cohnella candidum TaxID=2674991 RepID=A0A3G3JZI3_9BACL|nr:TerC family protein [Cohnella candidum]AYQ73665.1 TerC family protein [Cohnella candidum]
MNTEWLLALLQLMLINIVLSGDNAVVIAMACRTLEPAQQKQAIFWGTFGAVALRLVLTLVAVWLLRIPMVEAAGGLLLLYIAVNLLKGEEEEEHAKRRLTMGQAIRTIVVADVVMSLDNVVAVAGAAQGDWLLIGIGLAVSIPLIIWCSRLLTSIMKRFPILVWLGAGLLGYTAGEMLVKDEWVHGWLEPLLADNMFIVSVLTTIFVIVLGFAASRRSPKHAHGEGS